MVFLGAAAVLGGELRLQEAQDLGHRDARLVVVVELLLDPIRVTQVGHAEGLGSAEQDLAAVDRAGSAELRARRRETRVRDVAELVQVDAVDLDRRTGELLTGLTLAHRRVAQVVAVDRVELQLRHGHRRQEGVVRFLAARLHHATHVVFLGVGLELDEQLPSRGIGGSDGVLAGADDEALVGVVPAADALGARCDHVGGKLQVAQVGADARGAVRVVGVGLASHRQEGELVDAVGEPVGELVAAVLAEVHDRLLVGHAAFVPVGVAQLVDPDDLVVGLERFFVAFQRAIADDAVAFEVSKQGDDCAGALLGRLQLGDMLNDTVAALAQELVDEGQVARLSPEIERPSGLLLIGEHAEIGIGHEPSP